GTSVFLHVPRTAPAGDGWANAPASRPATNVLRVLVVDDHPAFQEGVRQILEAAPGIRVVAAAGSAGDGLNAVRQKRPDVVLLDLNLPDSSGIELAREIAGLEPTTVIVMMSAFAEEANVVEA